MIALLLAAAAAFPQESPKVTYEDSGDFRLLVIDLERRFKGRVRFWEGLPKKDVSVSLRDAGYFQALDALCRAHQEVTYFTRVPDGGTLERLTIFPGPWVEYPSSYEGHFKVALISMMRTVRSTSGGDVFSVQSEVALFGPPWIPVFQDSGSRLEWSVDEALAKDGRDVRVVGYPGTGPVELCLDGNMGMQGNYSTEVIRFLDFDASRGLKSLKGVAKLAYADTRMVRVNVAEGTEVRIPQGRLVVETVGKVEGDWRIVVVFKPDRASEAPYLEDVLGPTAFYEGGLESGMRLKFPWRSRSLAFRIEDLAEVPRWIEFKVRAAEHEVSIPFRFTDVAFKKD